MKFVRSFLKCCGLLRSSCRRTNFVSFGVRQHTSRCTDGVRQHVSRCTDVLASIPLGVQTVLANIPLGVQTETGRRSTGSHQRVVFKYCDSACTLRVRRPRPSSSFTAGFPSSPTPASTARGTVRRLKGPHEMKLLLLLIAFI